MGTPGVPLYFEWEKIVNAIKNRKGVMTNICKDLNASHGPLLRYINADPVLKEMLEEERNSFTETLCDEAENTLLYAVTQKKDLTNSLGAAKFILNNPGKKRGYTPPSANFISEDEKADLQAFVSGMKEGRSARPSDMPLDRSDSQDSTEQPQEGHHKSQ